MSSSPLECDFVTSRKIAPCDIILQLTKEVNCTTLLDSFNFLLYFAKYHPAGYSSEYLAGRKFASRIFGWNKTFTCITQKIRQYGQNESYSIQWHTKGFLNIKLVSLYSKSVSHQNSKCLHFASVQVKHMVQNRPFLSHSKQNEQ